VVKIAIATPATPATSPSFEETNKGETSVLLGIVVSRQVDITNTTTPWKNSSR
jgi:hypothetical protein